MFYLNIFGNRGKQPSLQRLPVSEELGCFIVSFWPKLWSPYLRDAFTAITELDMVQHWAAQYFCFTTHSSFPHTAWLLYKVLYWEEKQTESHYLNRIQRVLFALWLSFSWQWMISLLKMAFSLCQLILRWWAILLGPKESWFAPKTQNP